MSSSSSEDLSCDSPTCYNYIFSTFGGETSKNERQLDIYVSDDAVHWEALAMGTYMPANSLLRDPSIILHSDGFYYICHTTDWDGDNFAIIRSENLIDWEPVVTVKSSHDGFKVAQTWAPVNSPHSPTLFFSLPRAAPGFRSGVISIPVMYNGNLTPLCRNSFKILKPIKFTSSSPFANPT